MKKIKNLQIEHIALFLSVPLSFVLVDIFVKGFLGFRLISSRAIIYSFAIGMMFNAVNYLLKTKKAKLIYSTIIVCLACILGLSQIMYFSIFADFYSLTRLSSIQEFFVVKGETSKTLSFSYVLFLIIPFLNFLILFKFISTNKIKVQYKVTLIYLLGSILLYNCVQLTFRNQMDDVTQLYLTDDYLYDNVYNKSRSIERFGIFTYTYRDIYNIVKNSLKIEDVAKLEEINQYFDENSREKVVNDKTGMFEGKNVVLILAESLNTWGIHEEISPTMYKMATEGIYFKNYYSPRFPATTVDAEFAVNTGLVPSMDFGNTAYMFKDNAFPNSLANLFKKQGYSANSFHNSDGSFYNRFQYHEALGYDKFYDAEMMGIELPENFGYNWPTDLSLFEKSTEIILENYDENIPFLSYLITVSTHTPYDENRTYLKEDFEIASEIIDSNSEVQYYMAAARDLDNGIKHMMDEFEKQGILEDTVFVLFSDHYSYGMYHDLIWEYYTDYKGDFHRLNNVPFMIWTPGITPEVVEENVSQFEVYPTISNMFGLDNDLTYSMGNDVFTAGSNTIINGSRTSWQDENVIYENNQIYELFNEIADQKYIDNKSAYLIERLNIFQDILKNDYFDSSVYKEIESE